MLTAEAQVETERPGRYLVQLCRHVSQMGQHLRQRPRTHVGGDAPPEVQHVEWSDTYGIVRLSWGQWTMQTTPDTLTLRTEATDEENLRRIQDLVAARLEIFGRRGQLKVNWQRFEAPTAQRSEGEHGRGATTSTPRWVKVFPVILAKIGVHRPRLGRALRAALARGRPRCRPAGVARRRGRDVVGVQAAGRDPVRVA